MSGVRSSQTHLRVFFCCNTLLCIPSKNQKLKLKGEKEKLNDEIGRTPIKGLSNGVDRYLSHICVGGSVRSLPPAFKTPLDLLGLTLFSDLEPSCHGEVKLYIL